MKENNILVTGGSGLLGSELKKLMPDALFPTHNEVEVESQQSLIDYGSKHNIKTIFHGAAYTSPPKIDNDPIRALWINIIGTSFIVDYCMVRNIRLIYMSTDYVFDGEKIVNSTITDITKGIYSEDDAVNPVNKYAWSKLGGECAVKMYDNSLIIRASFGPKPFPYAKAFSNQYTSRLYVDQIAPIIVDLIKSNLTGIIHIGGKRRTVFEYAKETKEDVKPLFRYEVDFKVPKDTSLTSKYNKIRKDKK